MSERLIIDCDPGIDDAIAISLALNSPEVELRGLTTVFGNANIGITTRNARTLLRLAGRADLPVGRGAGTPLIGHYTDGVVAHIHGHDGLGDADVQRHPADDVDDELTAVELLRREVLAAPNALTILAVGPLTNVALFARLYPDVARQVRRVIIMGGAVLGAGNVTPGAEANIHNDPEAAEIALSFGWDVSLIGLDVTENVVLTADHLRRIGMKHDVLARAIPLYQRFARNADGVDGIMAHDPTALVFMLRPELFDTVTAPVRVELTGLGRGKTWAITRRADWIPEPWRDRPGVQYALASDSKAVAALITERLS